MATDDPAVIKCKRCCTEPVQPLFNRIIMAVVICAEAFLDTAVLLANLSDSPEQTRKVCGIVSNGQ